jgi:hypothetical protein
MERVTPTPATGYVLADKEAVKDILEVEAELLRSEGIDPQWPGFPHDKQREHQDK